MTKNIREREYDVELIKWVPQVHTVRVKSQNSSHARHEANLMLRNEVLVPDEKQPYMPYRTTIMYVKKVRDK